MATPTTAMAEIEPGQVSRHQHPDEDGGDQDLGRPATIAQGKVVGDDGDQPLARAVDDAGSDHTGSIAAEAHHHAQGLLAVRAGFS